MGSNTDEHDLEEWRALVAAVVHQHDLECSVIRQDGKVLILLSGGNPKLLPEDRETQDFIDITDLSFDEVVDVLDALLRRRLSN